MDLMGDYLTGGIDFDLPGNGGFDCLGHISVLRRILETILAVGCSAVAFVIGARKHASPPKPHEVVEHPYVYSPTRICLLVAMTFAFALELCYKLATRQFIFIINPCHMMCVVQIILLALPSTSTFVTYLYRIHLYFLHGPINAFLFPVTNTLFLPGEIFTYWLEHILLILIPVYLLRRGGPLFTVEKLSDSSYGLMAYGIWGFFHWLILDPLSVISLANLNSLLCPAISDPFHGANWRVWAIGHQFILNFVSGKLFGIFGNIEELPKKEVSQNGISDLRSGDKTD